MRIIKPREELRQYVRYYWIMERNEPFSVLTFPIGCPQIIFHRKNTLFIPETGNEQSNFTISGQVNFPAHICSGSDIVSFQFHHTQMDGAHAAHFLDLLQKEINACQAHENH